MTPDGSAPGPGPLAWDLGNPLLAVTPAGMWATPVPVPGRRPAARRDRPHPVGYEDLGQWIRLLAEYRGKLSRIVAAPAGFVPPPNGSRRG